MWDKLFSFHALTPTNCLGAAFPCRNARSGTQHLPSEDRRGAESHVQDALPRTLKFVKKVMLNSSKVTI